jgi:hypothetical protein
MLRCVKSTWEVAHQLASSIAQKLDAPPEWSRLRLIDYVGSTDSSAAMVSDVLTHCKVALPKSECNATYRPLSHDGRPRKTLIVQHMTDQGDWSYVCISPRYNHTEIGRNDDLCKLAYLRDSLDANTKVSTRLAYSREYSHHIKSYHCTCDNYTTSTPQAFNGTASPLAWSAEEG